MKEKRTRGKLSTSVSTAAWLAVCCKSLDDWDLLFLKKQFVIFRLSEIADAFSKQTRSLC